MTSGRCPWVAEDSLKLVLVLLLLLLLIPFPLAPPPLQNALQLNWGRGIPIWWCGGLTSQPACSGAMHLPSTLAIIALNVSQKNAAGMALQH